jgi:hypothetical protein
MQQVWFVKTSGSLFSPNCKVFTGDRANRIPPLRNIIGQNSPSGLWQLYIGTESLVSHSWPWNVIISPRCAPMVSSTLITHYFGIHNLCFPVLHVDYGVQHMEYKKQHCFSHGIWFRINLFSKLWSYSTSTCHNLPCEGGELSHKTLAKWITLLHTDIALV